MGCAGSTASGELLKAAQEDLDREKEAKEHLTRKRDTLEQRASSSANWPSVKRVRPFKPQALVKALSASKSKRGDTASEVQRLRTMICDLEDVEAAAKAARQADRAIACHLAPDICARCPS